MKWLLILSLALLVRGNPPPEPTISTDATTDTDPPITDLNDDSNDESEHVVEPEVEDSNLDGVAPEPPEDGIQNDTDATTDTVPPINEDLNDDSNDESEQVVEPEIAEINFDGVAPEPPEDGIQNDTDDSDHSRRKRYITTSTTLWPNNTVIYSYTQAHFPSEGSKSAIKFSMEYLTDRTCLSFTEVDQATYTASHVKFVVGTGCWAHLGYNPNWSTQCSCCSKGTCYHEMLHLLGFMHEHQRPDRDRYIEVDLLRIDPGKWAQFSKLSESSVDYTDERIYKVGSTMHYSRTAFQIDAFGSAIKTVNDDYTTAEDFYYPIREVNIRYNCKEARCADFTTECVNDGYATDYMSECQCVCPEGLNKQDGCRTALTSASNIEWPRGSYAFVAAGTGCPPGFNTGTRKHWSAGFSWAQTTNNPMKGTQDLYSTQYEFCVSRNNFDQSNNKWPAGVYCLLRVGGTCPDGFKSGAIQLDDKIGNYNNSKSGDLPDGVFDQDTKFEYCCRSDGLKTIAIELPLTNEFVLYNADNTINPDCQQVKYFNSRKFYYSFNNHVVSGASVASRTGTHPFSYTYSGVATFLFYICHYTPLDISCGGTIELDSNNPTQLFSTPNYPNNYGSQQQCNWLITAPEGSKIYLDFDSFDVDCTDKVQVRVLNIGEVHGSFCNHNGKTFRSYSNKMTVMFTTSPSAEAVGFQANVKYVSNEDNCYDFEDYGASYRGNANVTKYFEQCLPWSETIDCDYSSKHPKDASSGLDSNYCRNPGKADRPWCYTEATQCARQVCDVCQEGKVHDTYSDCQNLISSVSNFCAQDPRAGSKCRSSCIADHPLPAKPASRSSVSCSPPSTVPSDGTTTSTVKTSYDVGDKITYTCNNNPDSSVTLICSIEGVFNGFLSACKMCDDGWLALDGICYFIDNVDRHYTSARTTCESKDAKLIMPKGQVAFDFLAHNRNEKETWLGANDIASEGVWRWLDNTVIAPEDMHFGNGQPSNSSAGRDCATQLSIRNSLIWVDKVCSATNTYYRTICQKPARPGTCNDLIANCATQASQDSQFCNPGNGYSSLHCRGYCGCGPECGEGGLLYKGECYYAQTVTKKANEAKAVCAALGGSLPTVKSNEDNAFLYAIFPIQWIGLNDEQDEGVFVWPDNSPQGSYSLWATNYPDNYYDSDCVLSHYSKWYDRYCQYYNWNNFVCVVDELTTCDVPTASANSVIVTDYSKLYTDEELISECDSGYMVTSGDLRRYCLGDGSFAGSIPVCEEETSANVITPNNNVPLVVRGQKISTLQGYMFSGDYKDFEIPRAGEIVSWEYFSKQSGNVAFMVFRYIGTNLKIVGFNYITTQSSNQIHSIYQVPIADRIDVENGDRIGIWFPENKQVIEVNFHVDAVEWRYPKQQIRRTYNSYASTTDLVIGTTHNFYVSSSTTAEAKTLYGYFSLRANIGPRT